MSSADLNHHDAVDLIVSPSAASSISILLGFRDGTFRTRTTSTMGTFPTLIAVVDLNNGQHLDVAVTNNSTDSVSARLGNANIQTIYRVTSQ